MSTRTQIEYTGREGYSLQPEYQFSHNGFGLLQLSVNYEHDIDRAGKSWLDFARGAPLLPASGPLSNSLSESTWTLVKAEETGRDGNILRIKAMYAAIEGNAAVSQTEAVITSAAVSEPIESHPNFSVVQIPEIGDSKSSGDPVPLGGLFTNNAPPILQAAPDPKNPYRAYWVSGESSPGIFPWQFVSFLPTTDNKEVNRKAGVKSWFRPSITMRLTAYTSDSDIATETAYMVGWIMDATTFGLFSIPETYVNIVERDPIVSKKVGNGKNWLVTGTNVEVYGGLYKVTADLLLSGAVGWDPDIYPSYSQIAT